MWVKRSGIVFCIISFMFVLLGLRLFYVTYGEPGYMAQAAMGSRQSTLTLYRTKGTIYDSSLQPLAGKNQCYYLVINPRNFDRSKIDIISEITDTDKDSLVEKLNSQGVFCLRSSTQPEPIAGVYCYEGEYRYADQPVAQHILGYLDSDLVKGVAGIEKEYDDELSYFSAEKSITYESDAVNGVIAGLGITAKSSGSNSDNGIVLTLDKGLCEALEKSMNEHVSSGAAVVMDCVSGEILAMTSRPSYDEEHISDYLNSENGELINRAITNQPIGSAFKIVVAACIIENNLENFTYDCSGGIEIGGRVFACHDTSGHGHMNLNDAFANSCNSYFIAAGQLLGADKMIEMAKRMGFDSSIQIIRNISAPAGNLPEIYENYPAQATANISIGQGELLASPLQVARLTAIACNGGFLVTPSIYNGMYLNGEVTSQPSYNFRTQAISSDVAEKLRQMCINTVENGTGKSAKPDVGGAGGKTASAQTGKTVDGIEILDTYFTGFYPADNPQYVITVFANGGKSGSATCAPVFKEICNFIAQNR